MSGVYARPLGANVLVSFEQTEAKTKSGLKIPQGAQNVGEILSCGGEVSEVTSGDKVLLKRTIVELEEADIATTVTLPGVDSFLLVVPVSEVALVLE